MGLNRDRHWLSVLKKLNNLDKHSSLVMHAASVNQLIRVSTRDADGSEVFAITVERPINSDPPGELLTQVGPKTLQRSLAPLVIFRELAGHDDAPVAQVMSELQFVTRQAIIKLGAFLKPEPNGQARSSSSLAP